MEVGDLLGVLLGSEDVVGIEVGDRLGIPLGCDDTVGRADGISLSTDGI